jgi:hypothetical protein
MGNQTLLLDENARIKTQDVVPVNVYLDSSVMVYDEQ